MQYGIRTLPGKKRNQDWVPSSGGGVQGNYTCLVSDCLYLLICCHFLCDYDYYDKNGNTEVDKVDTFIFRKVGKNEFTNRVVVSVANHRV